MLVEPSWTRTRPSKDYCWKHRKMVSLPDNEQRPDWTQDWMLRARSSRNSSWIQLYRPDKLPPTCLYQIKTPGWCRIGFSVDTIVSWSLQVQAKCFLVLGCYLGKYPCQDNANSLPLLWYSSTVRSFWRPGVPNSGKPDKSPSSEINRIPYLIGWVSFVRYCNGQFSETKICKERSSNFFTWLDYA